MKTTKKTRVDIRAIYEEMEAYLQASLKRNLEKHNFDEVEHGFRWTPWQTQKLADLAAFRKENRAIVRRYWPEITGAVQHHAKSAGAEAAANLVRFAGRLAVSFKPDEIPPEIKRVLTPASPQLKPAVSVDLRLPTERKQVIDGLKGEPLRKVLETDETARAAWKAAEPKPDAHFFRTDRTRMDKLIEATEGELAKANRAILRRMDDVQREIIAKAEMFHLSGVMTTRQAIDKAAKEFLARGVDAIQYKDGKRVNVAAYAEMALRTARHRAYLAGEGEKRKQMGIVTVLVSSHQTACEKCIPWQGRILIDDVYSGGSRADGVYPLLSEAVAAGLLHPNCRHNLGTYYAGLSSLPPTVDEVRAGEWYRAEQKQRRLEREIRAQKRIVENALDEMTKDKEKQRLQELTRRLKEHLLDNPQFRRKPEREVNITL